MSCITRDSIKHEKISFSQAKRRSSLYFYGSCTIWSWIRSFASSSVIRTSVGLLYKPVHTVSIASDIGKKRQNFFHWILPLKNVNTSVLDVIVKFQLAMSTSSIDNMVSMCKTCVHPYGREKNFHCRLLPRKFLHHCAENWIRNPDI